MFCPKALAGDFVLPAGITEYFIPIALLQNFDYGYFRRFHLQEVRVERFGLGLAADAETDFWRARLFGTREVVHLAAGISEFSAFSFLVSSNRKNVRKTA